MVKCLPSGNNINCITTLSGFDGDVLSKVLRGQPDMKQEKHLSNYVDSLPKRRKIMRPPPTTNKMGTSMKHPAAKSKAILFEKTDTALVKGARNKDTHTGLSKPQLQDQKMSRQSYITIHEDIKEELRKGNYKVDIAPSDLVDFGGHKSFDMTHQLFIQHKGEFILMFNGRYNFCDPLPEYRQGDVTTECKLV
jgi:anti-sigma28 factor (negative regulator of flagellin synthesis)